MAQWNWILTQQVGPLSPVGGASDQCDQSLFEQISKELDTASRNPSVSTSPAIVGEAPELRLVISRRMGVNGGLQAVTKHDCCEPLVVSRSVDL